jgi:hypothetical protein
MSVSSPERVDADLEPMLFEAFEFEIVCDIAELSHEAPGFPACRGDAARWVAWRPACCPQAPRYRLLCDRCKAIYQAWEAKNAYIWCGICGNETGGFLAYTPLKG